MAPEKPKAKTVTVELRVVDPKKGAVKYSLPKDQSGVLTNIYVNRLEAMKELGISELGDLKGFKVTLEPITA